MSTASPSPVLLPPAYFGSPGRLALLWTGQGRVDTSLRYDKRRKATHRCMIADVNGPLRLTVPVALPAVMPAEGPLLWSHIQVSPHGKWPSEHVIALESAYGRTPWLEFFIDRLAAILKAAPGRTLTDFTADIDRAMLSMLPPPPPGFRFEGDLQAIADKELPPYRQVRQQKLGFIAGLSAIDMLMNLGPAASAQLLITSYEL